MENISFEDLGLDELTLKAVEAKGFEVPSPIQVLAIPRLLEGDANLIAKARTGTGKTAAFGLPLVQKIREDKGFPQALILTPTRELCLQVCKEIQSFSSDNFPRMASVYGGQSMGEQIRNLKKGVEIVVGTPGRVKDHIERGTLKLENISYFILDEADEMLDMGFIEDIEEIFGHANPDSRILLFSATMPPQILKIASQFMGDYEVIEEEKRPEEPLLTEQRYWVVRENEKIEALVRLIDISPDFYGLVFTQTKVDADSVCKQLDEKGYEVAALHGDIPQAQREKILYRFRNKKTRILVATDVAARGIDIEGLTHVVNYALPFDVPTYVHRIGRTGRAGAKGLAFTFVRPEERRKLEFIKQAAFKSTKGKLTEEEIPSVKEVLKIKEKKLFEQMQSQLGFLKPENETENPDSSDTENQVETVSVEPTKKQGNATFEKMAQILCETRDPMEVLSEVLALSYGKSLDPKRYGEITPLKVFNQGRQIRLYVQMGRKDGYSPKDIANYFSKLLKIPQRMVDRIDLSEKFVLVSLPYQAGMDLVARAKKDKSLPSMHIDSKESQAIYKSEKSGRKGKFSDSSRGSKNSRRSSDRKSGNGSNYREDGKRKDKSNSGSRKKSGFSGNREGGSKPIHTNKTSNASLYKK
ncbi:MAG: DEAD/DEAH box helicase [Spirochaetaceae bacterium]|nr:DEAD/DEAH box helicase [Spirochaetaceae bacterium]